mgnify:CR=1 FL=1
MTEELPKACYIVINTKGVENKSALSELCQVSPTCCAHGGSKHPTIPQQLQGKALALDEDLAIALHRLVTYSAWLPKRDKDKQRLTKCIDNDYNIWWFQKIFVPLHPMKGHRNGWWLWVGVLWKQSKAERGIENGLQIVTRDISQSPELPLYKERLLFLSKITK